MSSDLERAKLARLAMTLNKAPDLPPLILMSDEIRLPDPMVAAGELPPRSAVILRCRHAATRRRLAVALKRVAIARDLVLLIAGDPALASRISADGIHLPERDGQAAAHWKALRPKWLVTVAAHSAAAVAAAGRARADAAIVAPVFRTRSHPGRAPLGATAFRIMAQISPLPVYALGGINSANASLLAAAHVAGIAAIDGLASDQRE